MRQKRCQSRRSNDLLRACEDLAKDFLSSETKALLRQLCESHAGCPRVAKPEKTAIFQDSAAALRPSAAKRRDVFAQPPSRTAKVAVTMNDARLDRVWGLVALCVVSPAGGCHHDSTSKRDPAVLDGVQRTAARRVGLESAIDAMQRRDLDRLKMLRVWARTRTQVALFDADDLASLDLAIACLDGTLARADRQASLDKIKSGKLLQPTSDLCLADSE
jgi:hypothetical protein